MRMSNWFVHHVLQPKIVAHYGWTSFLHFPASESCLVFPKHFCRGTRLSDWLWKSLNVRFWRIFCMFIQFIFIHHHHLPTCIDLIAGVQYFLFLTGGHRWFIYLKGGLDFFRFQFSLKKPTSPQSVRARRASTSWPQSFSRKDSGACNAVSHLTVLLPYCIQAFSTCHNPTTIML